MLTVTSAFDTMRQALEQTEAEQTAASSAQNGLRDKLRDKLGGVARDFLTGSYARRTAIRPLHDIDLFVVLDPAAHSDVYPTTHVLPSACLKKLQRAIQAAYPGTTAGKLQARSVGIVFQNGAGFDIVPAFENRAGVYMIPDQGRDAWIQTDPEEHRKALVAANEKAGSKLNPLIKMAKHWKATHDVSLRSFHLEVMAYGAFATAPASYPAGVRALFGQLAGAVLKACPEPAGVGPNIDAGMTQPERTTVREKLLAAEKKAGEAVAFDAAGKTAEAHAVWRGLFGSAYPEA